MSKLWFLQAREDLPRVCDKRVNPWKPWYDKTFEMVIRAETETEAREIATKEGNVEVCDNGQAWLSPQFSTCEELPAEGPSGLICCYTMRA